MKKMILALVAMLMVSSVSFAQERRERRGGERGERMTQEQMIQMRTDRTVEQLGLDEAQAAALLKLNTDYAEKLRPMMGFHGQRGQNADKQTRPTEEEMKAMHQQMEENQKAYNEELKKILTEEQMAKYEELQKERAQRGHGPGRGNGERRHRNND